MRIELPESTEVRRQLQKVELYRKFGWSASQRESFDADVSRLDFVNWLSPRTMPAIAEGTEVKEIFVVEVQLKRRDFDPKNIDLLGRSIPQRIVWLLRYEGEAKLAVFHDKLFLSKWKRLDELTFEINGLNYDSVWENIVSSIGEFTVEQDKSLTAQIKVDEERDKLMRKIEMLEKQMRMTSQVRRQREIYAEIKKIRSQL